MGVCSDHAAGRSIGKREKTPVVAGTGRLFGCSMISATTNRGRLYLMLFESCLVSSATVREEFEENVGKSWRFLPAKCGPESGPDECLNHDVKPNHIGRNGPSAQHQMMSDCLGYPRNNQGMSALLGSYLCAKAVR
jgi:hypothetical protein